MTKSISSRIIFSLARDGVYSICFPIVSSQASQSSSYDLRLVTSSGYVVFTLLISVKDETIELRSLADDEVQRINTESFSLTSSHAEVDLHEDGVLSFSLCDILLYSADIGSAILDIEVINTNFEIQCGYRKTLPANLDCAIYDECSSAGHPRLVIFGKKHESNGLRFVDGESQIKPRISMESKLIGLNSSIHDFDRKIDLGLWIDNETCRDSSRPTRARPMVEFDGFCISANSIRGSDVRFTLEMQGVSIEIHPRLRIAKSAEDEGRGHIYVRSIVPISRILKKLPIDRGTVTLRIGFGSTDGSTFEFLVGSELFMSMAKYSDREGKATDKHSISFKLGFLDWASLLFSANIAEHIRNKFPDLYSFLLTQTDDFGGLQSGLTGGPKDQTYSAIALNPESVQSKLTAALRFFASEIAQEPSSRKLPGKIIDLAQDMSGDERAWLAINIMCIISPIGPWAFLADLPSEDFLWNFTQRPDDFWRNSSLIALFAAKQEYGMSVALLDGLADNSGIESAQINISAICCALDLVLHDALNREIRSFFFAALRRLMDRYDSREFTLYRHEGIQRGLAELLVASLNDPADLRLEIQAYLSHKYSTIPEFWEHMRNSLNNLPASSLKSVLHDWYEEHAFSGTLTLFTQGKCLRFPVTSEVDREIRAEKSRTQYLARIWSLQSGSVIPFGDPEREEDKEWAVRFMALPQDPDSAGTRVSVDALEIRRFLRQNQRYPTSSDQHFLDALGQAAAESDVESILEFFSGMLRNRFAINPEFEVQLLDVMAWLVGTHQDACALYLELLIERVISRMQTIDRHFELPAPLHSCVSRILKDIDRSVPDSPALRVFRSEVERLQVANRSADRSTSQVKLHSRDESGFFSDTMIAIVTCQANLSTRALDCINSWVEQVRLNGAQVCVFYGVSQGVEVVSEIGGIPCVGLNVGDLYEDLPEKVLSIFRWVRDNTSCQYVVKIDDDCLMDPRIYLNSLNYRGSHYFGRPLTAYTDSFNRAWHQAKSSLEDNAISVDTSLTGTCYADGGGAYSVSRAALEEILMNSDTAVGEHLRVASYYEDKLVGDLLALSSVRVESVGYSALQARRNFPNAVPTLQIDRTFYPSYFSGTSIAHLDRTDTMEDLVLRYFTPSLLPSRIFPLDVPISFSSTSNMLEFLGVGQVQGRVDASRSICVSVMRNEIHILPHFLTHYRQLGVDLFLVVDNLSSDGTREYLLEQKDVIVLSAACDYKNSHFGVDWQRMILDHFCIGRWVLVADADEFLLTEGEKPVSLAKQCELLEEQGYEGACVCMVDMYPSIDLSFARFENIAPQLVADCYDFEPVRQWPYNRGPFGNFSSFVSSLRHRLIPSSSPEMYTAQKFALFKYNPLVSFSEGLHFVAGLRFAPTPLAFLHYKYSSEFFAKASTESAREQHFNGAHEYKAYAKLGVEGKVSFWDDGLSRVFEYDSPHPLVTILGPAMGGNPPRK